MDDAHDGGGQAGPATSADPDWLRSRRAFAVTIAGVLVVAAVVAGAGIRTLPPEAHDVYAVQAVYEMHERGSWLVPYFNGNLRLQKPPLGYWLTAGAAFVSGARGEIEIWHGRAGSALAGLALVGAAIALGTMLVGRLAGLVGGLVLACTVGFLGMTHSARPDMLYAALCAWQFASLIAAARAPDRSRRQRLAGWASWALAGLAIMAKGPQIPLFVVVAVAAWLLGRGAGAGRTLRTLRPLVGIPFCLILAAPWFVYIALNVGQEGLTGSEQLGRQEFSGSDLQVDWLAPLRISFYTYHPLQLARMMLPWIVLLPGAIVVCFARGPLRDATRPLAWLTVVVLIAFGFGAQQRTHYMLPLLPAISVLAAAGIARNDWLPSRSSDRAGPWPLLVIGHAVAAIALMAWVAWIDIRAGRSGGLWMTWVAAGLIGALTAGFEVAAGRGPGRPLSSARAGPVVVALMFTAAFAAVGWRDPLWWGTYQEDAFAQEAARLSGPGVQMTTLHENFPSLVYYTRRPVRHFGSIRGLARAAAREPETTFAVVLRAEDAAALPERLRVERVLEGERGDGAYWVVLVDDGGETAPR